MSNTPDFTAEDTGFANNATVSLECPANGNSYMLVAISQSSNFNTSTVSVATYNGVAMVPLAERIPNGSGRWMALYELVTPAAGVNNIQLNWSNSSPFAIAAASYSDIESTGGLTSTFNTGESGQPSSDSISPNTNDIIVGFVAHENSIGVLQGTNQTLIKDVIQGDISTYASWKLAAGGAESSAWTGSTTGKWSSIIHSMVPASTSINSNITAVYDTSTAVDDTVHSADEFSTDGTNFESSQSTGTLEIGGLEVDSYIEWSNVSVRSIGPASGLMFGSSNTVEILPASNTSSTWPAVTYLPPENYGYITFTQLGIDNMTSQSIGWDTGLGTPISGLTVDSQVYYSPASSATDTADVIIEADTGNFTRLENVATQEQYSFDVIVRDVADGNDSGIKTVTINSVEVVVAPVMPADFAIEVYSGTQAVNNASQAISGTAPVVYTLEDPADQAIWTIDSTNALLTFILSPTTTPPTHAPVITGTNTGGSDTQVVNITMVATGSASGVPLISGTESVGSILSASIGSVFDPDGIDTDSIIYFWDNNGSLTQGDTYLLTESTEGNVIDMYITFEDLLGNSEVLNALPSGIIQPYAPPVQLPSKKTLKNNQTGTLFDAQSYNYTNYLLDLSDVLVAGFWEDDTINFAARDIITVKLQDGWYTLRFINTNTTVIAID